MLQLRLQLKVLLRQRPVAEQRSLFALLDLLHLQRHAQPSQSVSQLVSKTLYEKPSIYSTGIYQVYSTTTQQHSNLPVPRTTGSKNPPWTFIKQVLDMEGGALQRRCVDSEAHDTCKVSAGSQELLVFLSVH